MKKFSLKLLLLSILSLMAIPGFSQVVINEIQTSNIYTKADEYGKYNDWIELYNAGSNSVNLAGYKLTDNPASSTPFTFPEHILPSGGFVLIHASDTLKNDITSAWRMAVNASSSWKYRANNSTPPTTNWRTLSFNDGSWSGGNGGIGFGDSDDATTVPICISVFMRKTFTISDTSKIYEGVFAIDYDDGFVAYLNGEEIARVNIGSRGVLPPWNKAAFAAHEAVMYQGNSPDSFYLDRELLKSLLRNGTNVLAVEVHNQSSSNSDLTAKPYLFFNVAGGTTAFSNPPSWFKLPAPSAYHAPFKLSRIGETIYLYNATGSLIDQRNTGSIEPDNSSCRIPNGSANWCLSNQPTPGTSNNSSACGNGYTSIPLFSLNGGFYSGTQTLVLSTPFPGGVIRYTLDGSDVTSSSPQYTSPIQLTSLKTVRARVFANGYLPGPTVTNTYFINFNCKLPVYSLTTDPDNLWDYNTGIFELGPNASGSRPYWGANFWQDWEKPVNVEFYDRSKTRVFRFNSGMKITGGWSRSANQKSLEIMLGDKYDLSELNYPLMSDKPWIDKWDDFILHTTGNDRDRCKMRDPLMCRLLKPTHNDYLAYEPCLVVLNGENWGVYYMRENDDHHWIEGNYGYKKDEIDLLKESYFYPGIEVKKGSDSAFFVMHNYATTTSPTDPSFYQTMNTMMDLENMADYFIAETYYPNDDWMDGSNNNLKLWRPRKPDGRFRYLIYDLDFGLGYNGSVNNNMLGKALDPSPHNYNSDLFQALTKNQQFKRYFINRYADLMNTIFLPSSIQSMAYLFRDSLRNDMHYQHSKWGGDSLTWKNTYIPEMLNFANQRPSYARDFVQSEFNLQGKVTLTLQVSPAGAGVIQISTITPETYPWNGVYFNGNPVTITAIPNPGYTFSHWRSNNTISSNNPNQSVTYNFTSSDVITCYFSGSPVSPSIAFSELNYHSGNSVDGGDWIELHNNGTSALDVSKWELRDEADNHVFQFPVSTVIPAGSYLVAASDLLKFQSAYPDVTNVTGGFGFDFSNSGETIRLFDRSKTLITSVSYYDQQPWPLEADGAGYTLERLNEQANANDPSNWFAGCLNGSPGRAYSAPAISMSHNGNVTLCSDSSLTLIASGSGSIEWYRNGSLLTGMSGSQFQVNTGGTYKAKITSNGCSAFSNEVSISIIQPSVIASVTGDTICGAGTVELSAVSQGTIQWYDVAGNLLSTGNTLTTTVQSTTVFYAGTAGQCPAPRMEATAVVEAVPPVPVIADRSRCGAGSVILSAQGSDISWYDSRNATMPVATGNSFITPVISQSTIYYAESGTSCRSQRVSASVTILPVPAAPLASDTSRCGDGVLMLHAVSNEAIRWYDSQTGGNLLHTGADFVTPSLASTTTYYAETGDQCTSGRTAANAVINPVSASPVAGDQTLCGPGQITFTAQSNETVTWYDETGTALHTGNVFTTPFISGSTTYLAAAGVTCPSPQVQVHASILPVAAAPVSQDESRCGDGILTLQAFSNEAIRWYDSQTGGNLLHTGANFVTPSLSSTTTFYAEAGDQCASSRTAVNAVINPVSASPVVNDQTLCGPGQVTFTAQSTETVTWYDATGTVLHTGNVFTTPFITNSTTYLAGAGVTCPSPQVQVNASILPVAAAPVAQDESRCGDGSITLTAVSAETIRWYDAAAGGNLLHTGATYTTANISQTTIFYAEAGDVCPGSRTAVTATIMPLTPDPLITPAAVCGGGSMTLSAVSNEPLTWYDQSGNVIGTGTQYITPQLQSSAVYFVQAMGICPSDQVAVEATVHPLPLIDLGNDTVFSGISMMLDAGAGFSAYLWNTNETVQAIEVTSAGTYSVTVTDANGCTASDQVEITFITGVETASVDDGVVLYPNPATGSFRIKADDGSLLKMLDASGRLVKIMNIDAGRLNSVDITDMPAGIYFVTVEGKEMLKTIRLSVN